MPTDADAQERFDGEQRAYWQQRDELLQKYAGKWVALVGGQVVAFGDQMNKVAAEAWRKTGSGLMYVNLVGGEDVYNALVRISGQSVLATADCREDLGEDILGRDVINEFSMTLCQKRDQVEFEQA